MKPIPTPVPQAAVTVRLLEPSDSIGQITRLLHRAYAPQMAMGLKPLAGRQDDSVTRERCLNSECYLALLGAGAPVTTSAAAKPGTNGAASAHSASGARIVGVILFEEHEKVTFPPFFLHPDVCHFAQFAVDPDQQGLGIGRLLLDKVEQRSKEKGASELALSMAEPDTKLLDFYLKRGFRLIEYWQWPYTNYRSCILSKRLAA